MDPAEPRVSQRRAGLGWDFPWREFHADGRSLSLSAGVMPKHGLDVSACEVFRFYKLITLKGLIEPISMIVPRRVSPGMREGAGSGAAPEPWRCPTWSNPMDGSVPAIRGPLRPHTSQGGSSRGLVGMFLGNVSPRDRSHLGFGSCFFWGSIAWIGVLWEANPAVLARAGGRTQFQVLCSSQRFPNFLPVPHVSQLSGCSFPPWGRELFPLRAQGADSWIPLLFSCRIPSRRRTRRTFIP